MYLPYPFISVKIPEHEQPSCLSLSPLHLPSFLIRLFHSTLLCLDKRGPKAPMMPEERREGGGVARAFNELEATCLRGELSLVAIAPLSPSPSVHRPQYPSLSPSLSQIGDCERLTGRRSGHRHRPVSLALVSPFPKPNSFRPLFL